MMLLKRNIDQRSTCQMRMNSVATVATDIFQIN
jgi:hypothetical protein